MESSRSGDRPFLHEIHWQTGGRFYLHHPDSLYVLIKVNDAYVLLYSFALKRAIIFLIKFFFAFFGKNNGYFMI